MSRLTIDVSDQQHQALKAMAALHGMTLKEYAIEKLFPAASDEEQALKALQVLLKQRIAESKKGGVVNLTLTKIAERAMKRGRRA